MKTEGLTQEQITKLQKIEKLVMDVVTALDNDKKLNIERYKLFFNNTDPKELVKWAESMGQTEDATIQIFELPFEECKITQIKKAADILNMPLEEYVWYRDKDDQPIRTHYPVPVGYVPIKRLQQMIKKKNHINTDAEKRGLKSGQVTGESKVASIIDSEAYALLAVNADKIMEEFYGPRADGFDKKSDFYNQIAVDGYADLSKLTTDLTKHTALNTLNTYLLASGLRSDLVTKTLKTAYTLKKDLK